MGKEKQKYNLLFSILATILILIAGISFWFYKEVYNKDNFQKHVSTAITTQESRDAIASLIIEQGFKNRPVLRNLFAEQAESALAGLLDGPRVQNILNRFILRVYDSLFSTEPKAISIDLSSIKNIVSRLSLIIESVTDKDIQNVQIPDAIVLVRAGDIPSIASFGLTLLWIGPIALITGLGLVIWLFWRAHDRASISKILGGCLAVGSLIMLLLTAWYKPVILAMFKDSYARTVGEQIFNEFLTSLNNQYYFLLFIGILFILGGYIYKRYYAPSPVKTKSSGK